MSNEINSEAIPTAEAAPVKPSGSGGGMGLRLGILLGVFLLGACGVMGFRFYMDAQLPKKDPTVQRPEVTADTDMGNSSGAMPQAPGA